MFTVIFPVGLVSIFYGWYSYLCCMYNVYVYMYIYVCMAAVQCFMCSIGEVQCIELGLVPMCNLLI